MYEMKKDLVFVDQQHIDGEIGSAIQFILSRTSLSGWSVQKGKKMNLYWKCVTEHFHIIPSSPAGAEVIVLMHV